MPLAGAARSHIPGTPSRSQPSGRVEHTCKQRQCESLKETEKGLSKRNSTRIRGSEDNNTLKLITPNATPSRVPAGPLLGTSWLALAFTWNPRDWSSQDTAEDGGQWGELTLLTSKLPTR